MRVIRPDWPFRSRSVTVSSPAVNSPFRVFPIAVLIAVVAALTAAISYNTLYADKIYPGVSIANLDLGGQTEDKAREILEAKTNEYGNSKFVLHYQDRRWDTTPFELGLSVDFDETVQHGYKVGRQGGLLSELVQGILLRARGHSSVPVFSFDETAQRRVLGGIAAEIAQSPVNATISVDDSGVVRVTLPKNGLRLDVDATIAQLEQSFDIYRTHDAELVVKQVPAEITDADLAQARSIAEEMVSKPLVLNYGDKSWTIGPIDVARMLTFQPTNAANGKVGVSLESSKLLSFLEKVAADVKTEAQDATIHYQGGQFVISDSVEGKAVDLDATAVAINGELTRGNHTVPLTIKTVRPAITEDDLIAVRATAETIVSAPIEVRLGNDTWTLSRARLADMLVFSRVDTGGRPSVVADLDREALTKFAQSIAQQVDRKPRDARFRFENGKLSLTEKEQDGVSVNVEQTVAAIEAASTTSQRQVALPVSVEEAKVKASDLSSIVVKDLLVSTSTSFAGAIPEKAHNIALATSRLTGVVVPPGEVFSMNASLGPATLASGFQIGYGITMEGNNMATVPSVAGGICQVATTLYHAAFWAGLKIEERYPHLYWIPRYGQPPGGLKGLDATVDDPYVDLKFRNNTGNWIAIQGYTSGSNVYFSIYGTNPGWKVTAEEPIITNVVQPDTATVEEEDPSMPPGKTLWIEQAEPGFDSTIIRHVTDKDGNEIDRYVVTSHYRPSRNVLLVSPKAAATPTPAPEAPTPVGTPAPTATPQATGTATP